MIKVWWLTWTVYTRSVYYCLSDHVATSELAPDTLNTRPRANKVTTHSMNVAFVNLFKPRFVLPNFPIPATPNSFVAFLSPRATSNTPSLSTPPEVTETSSLPKTIASAMFSLVIDTGIETRAGTGNG